MNISRILASETGLLTTNTSSGLFEEEFATTAPPSRPPWTYVPQGERQERELVGIVRRGKGLQLVEGNTPGGTVVLQVVTGVQRDPGWGDWNADPVDKPPIEPLTAAPKWIKGKE